MIDDDWTLERITSTSNLSSVVLRNFAVPEVNMFLTFWSFLMNSFGRKYRAPHWMPFSKEEILKKRVADLEARHVSKKFL